MPWNTALAKIGAIFYLLWGLVHFNAAYGVWQLAHSLPPNVAQGRLQQNAFYLFCFATTAIAFAPLRRSIGGSIQQRGCHNPRRRPIASG
jgi:hypothetical protein